MRAASRFVVLFGVLVAASPSLAAPTALFPDEVYRAGASSLSDKLALKPLWTADALKPYRQRMRMSIEGIAKLKVSVELDETSEGKWAGSVRTHDGQDLNADSHFNVGESDVPALISLIERANLWTTYPEFFHSPQVESEICLDGEMVVFERIDASGYRYAEGNAQCDLGGAQLAVAAKILELAKRPDLKRLLE